MMRPDIGWLKFFVENGWGGAIGIVVGVTIALASSGLLGAGAVTAPDFQARVGDAVFIGGLIGCAVGVPVWNAGKQWLANRHVV